MGGKAKGWGVLPVLSLKRKEGRRLLGSALKGSSYAAKTLAQQATQAFFECLCNEHLRACPAFLTSPSYVFANSSSERLQSSLVFRRSTCAVYVVFHRPTGSAPVAIG